VVDSGMAEQEHDWVSIERAPGSALPLYRCAQTGLLGHIRGRLLKGQKANVVPYRCHVKGCKKSAIHRNYGLTPDSTYKWACEDHRDPV